MPPPEPFPPFLATDPYPPRPPGSRPLSSSSAWTDASSEFASEATPKTTINNDDDENNNKKSSSSNSNKNNIPTTLTGPVGDPALPPSRPTSLDVSKSGSTMHPPVSRRGIASFRATHGDAADGPSRPGSATLGHRTHVPSLTPSSFFRPMSSQKLQAQRGGVARPTTAVGQAGQAGRASEESTMTMRRHRYSNASVNTLREGLQTQEGAGEAPPMPVSRGTVQGEVAGSVVSHGSEAPLRGGTSKKPELSRLRSTHSPPKSPRSFRASLGLNSRGSKDPEHRRPAPGQHEKLHSDPSSPNDDEKPQSLPTVLPPPTTSRSKNGRNYEYYAGNTLFFLQGRCLNTKAKPLNLVTFSLTTLPAVLFFIFSAPWLWHHISPALPIVVAYIYFLAFSSFLHAAFSDPGILPRNLHPHPPNPAEDRDPLTLGPPTTEWVMVKTFAPTPTSDPEQQRHPPVNTTLTTAMEVPTKYCKTCAIWRPPRAHHCRVCDACIETQDHHCVWLNNCVGRRNYRYFFSYVGFGSLFALLILSSAITHVACYARDHHISFPAALQHGGVGVRVSFALFLYACLALPYPGSLFAYHVFLLARGETTREYLNSHKFMPKDRHRPFRQVGWLRNWGAVLCRPRGKGYMDFEGRYQEECGRRLGFEGRGGAGMRGVYSLGGGGMEMKELGRKREARGEDGMSGFSRKGLNNTGNTGKALSGPLNNTPR
ncbi:hypothetical protein M433DRAFT_158090 [Acidomyces richmondensis BFW]|nr:hypothetical protein M433DRAFT_158090 [Acidomyces richmondensis BFW]